MANMVIVIQYFDGCPNWHVADERVRVALSRIGRSEDRVEHQRIETAEDAERLGFRGSPTILIDGQDPFAAPNAPVGLTCRIFVTPGGPAGSPTVEQIEVAVAESDEGAPS